MTTETYFILCKECKLDSNDMELMDIGFCLDYIGQYFEMKNPSKKKKIRKAEQSDFDSF